MAILLSEGFGFDRFRRLFVATYAIDGTKIRAFLHPTGSESEARSLLKAWAAHLEEYGAVPRAASPEDADLMILDLYGLIDMAWADGPVVGGVHQAPNPEAAAGVARRLRQAVRSRIQR